MPPAPLCPKPHANSSQGRFGGASGAYKGVKENLCLQTCEANITFRRLHAVVPESCSINRCEFVSIPHSGYVLSVLATG